MTTEVINIKDAPAGWRENPAYVYIGRSGRGMSSLFGNPVRFGYKCPTCKQLHPYNDEGRWEMCYRLYLEKRLFADRQFKELVKRLRGKTLVCFCKPNPCHGDILAEYAEKLP
ncbi:hypothetical protein GEOBRER4_n0424 [Citrifermentans bremense]|uniref:DUF4326 domain-containing protein n=1 Tax=Citrifermentans bremense TaxID=60035 RepID=A0A7R7FSY9_9BACT|nr:DUF4326 domain-containing protein [Citrifermentans bremense]BCO11168.1 hypothetical protein GEOBRER4_n0424 [Citrifermentans bremense]